MRIVFLRVIVAFLGSLILLFRRVVWSRVFGYVTGTGR